MVTGWNNGKHRQSGAGYGFKVRIADRDKFFKKEWKSVKLDLADSSNTVEVNIDKPSFWKSCSELISKKIGIWLREKRLAPWPKGNPPKFSMETISKNHFLVYPLENTTDER